MAVTAIIASSVPFMSCAGDGSGEDVAGNGGENIGVVEYRLSDISKVFGFDGQNRYAYCPSIAEIDGVTHMWFCGNPDEDIFIDNIYHVAISADGTVSEPVSVLQPGEPGEWDSHHVCDPSVIKGRIYV